MKKKLFNILLILILFVGLTGCVNSVEKKDNNTNLTTDNSNNVIENEEKIENNQENPKNNFSIIGTYKAKESSIYNKITINEDYSCYFLATSPDISYDSSCTYEYDDENITFNLESGDIIKTTFYDDTLLWKNYIDGYDLKFYKE